MLHFSRWKVLPVLAAVLAVVFAVPYFLPKPWQDTVGKSLAIILDGQVISAPRIMEPILGGSGQISGQFTNEDANSLAIVLRSGALPARLVYIDATTNPLGKPRPRG